MIKFKKKGFTLIELLAVLVILAVIALIVTPIILNIVEKARKSAFLDSAYGISDAARLTYVEGMLEEKVSNDKTFLFDNGQPEGLNYSGSNPKGGTVIVRTDGTILLAIHNGKWCASKGANDTKITLSSCK